MTFSQLYDDFLDIELSSEDLTQLFTTARRKAAVNAGMQAFVRMTGCTKKYGTIPITADEPEYNVYSTLTDWIRLAGAPSVRKLHSGVYSYVQGQKDFPRRDPEELDRLEPSWRAADSGTPAAWYIKEDTGEYLLGLYPPPDVPSGDTWDLIVPYVAKPTVMSADGSEPFTIGGSVMLRLEPYHQALVHYAAAVLEPLRKNYAGAQQQMQLYSGFVAQFLQQQQEDGPDQITLVRDYYGESVRTTRALDPRRYP